VCDQQGTLHEDALVLLKQLLNQCFNLSVQFSSLSHFQRQVHNYQNQSNTTDFFRNFETCPKKLSFLNRCSLSVMGLSARYWLALTNTQQRTLTHHKQLNLPTAVLLESSPTFKQ